MVDYSDYALKQEISTISGGGGSGDVTLEQLTTTSGDIVDQIPSLTGYATESWVSTNYIDNPEMTTISGDIIAYVDSEIATVSGGGSGDVTQEQLTTTSGDIVSQIPSLTGYATETWVGNNYVTVTQHTTTSGDIVSQIPSLSGYATESWVNSQGYIDLTQLATTSGDIIAYVDQEISTVSGGGGITLEQLTTTSGDIITYVDEQISTISGGGGSGSSTASGTVFTPDDSYVEDPWEFYATAEMSNDTTPSPNVTSASDNYGSYYPYRAFSQNTGLYWLSDSGFPAWIKYYFGGAGLGKIITKMKFYTGPTANRVPTDWTFEGSLDDSNWDTLITKTSMVSPGANSWTDWFSFDNTTAYPYYRMKITQTVADASYTEVAEIYMVESTHVNNMKYIGIDTDDVREALLDIDTNVYTHVNSVSTLSGSYFTNCVVDGEQNTASGYVTPVLKSNTEPSPYVADADSNYSDYYAWKAFNQNGSTTYWMSSSSSHPHWLEIYLGEAKAINKYRFLAGSDANADDRCPSVWKLQGSNNGSDWTDLHENYSLSYPGDDVWTDWFTFDNGTLYLYYRIYIEESINSTTYTQIAELQLVSADPIKSFYYIDSVNVDALSALQEMDNNLYTVISGTNALIPNSLQDVTFRVSVLDGATNSGTDYATADMTGSSAPPPYVVDSDSVYSTYYPWQVFDRDITTFWLSSSSSFPHWVSYYFGTEGKIINKYRFIMPNNSSSDDRCPSVWKLQGSTDNSNWVDLHEGKLDEYPGDEVWTEWFTFENGVPYKYYRFYVTEAFNSTSYFMLGELHLVEEEITHSYNYIDSYVSDAATALEEMDTNLYTVITDQSTASGIEFVPDITYVSKSGDPYATEDMTSNTTPSPYEVSAESSNGSTYYPWKAFTQDGNSSYWLSGFENPRSSVPTWVKYYFGATESGKIINRLRMMGTADADRYPKDWLFQGSWDDSVWTTLHEVTGDTDPGNGVWSSWVDFTNTEAFPYYRIYITDITGTDYYAAIAEIHMVEADIVNNMNYIDYDATDLQDAVMDLDSNVPKFTTGSATWSGTGGSSFTHNYGSVDHMVYITPLDTNPGSWWVSRGSSSDIVYSDTLSGTGTFLWSVH